MPEESPTPADENREIARLQKINAALMRQIERSTDHQGNAYSLFQTAISLEGQVKRRTEELTTLLESLEQSNRELGIAKTAAETANISKTRFLAAASHDLLQPLNAAHLLMSSLSELQSSSESKALAEQVERSLETIDELLRALLEISSLDAGVVKHNIQAIPLRNLFASLESDFKPIANQKNIRIRFMPTNRHVLSDRTMLRRVLQNIISNAIRYTAKGGVLVGTRLRGDTVRIEVHDTGIGIQASQFTEIFEEFHRGTPAGQASDESSAGLGLGLSIVQRMLKTLDHRLEFDSEPGQGSVFSVYVPISTAFHSDSPHHSPSKDLAPPGGVAGAKVLLVENDQSVRLAMKSLLDKWHCESRAASHTAEALSRLDAGNWQPSIILADQHLDMGDLGSTTIQAVRQRGGKDIPAIIITADPDEELAQHANRQGIEMMLKPVKPAELRALLAHVLTH